MNNDNKLLQEDDNDGAGIIPGDNEKFHGHNARAVWSRLYYGSRLARMGAVDVSRYGIGAEQIFTVWTHFFQKEVTDDSDPKNVKYRWVVKPPITGWRKENDWAAGTEIRELFENIKAHGVAFNSLRPLIIGVPYPPIWRMKRRGGKRDGGLRTDSDGDGQGDEVKPANVTVAKLKLRAEKYQGRILMTQLKSAEKSFERAYNRLNRVWRTKDKKKASTAMEKAKVRIVKVRLRIDKQRAKVQFLAAFIAENENE